MEQSDRLTEGPIVGKILRFTWPLFLGNLFQQLYNVADSLIVGNMLGNTALAAVSSTGSLVFLIISLFMGVSMGSGVVVARFFGAEDFKKMRLAIHTSLCFGAIAGVLLIVVGVLFTPHVLVLMDTDESVLPQSIAYLRIIFAGSLGMTLYNTCTGIMRSVGDSKNPLYYLIISSFINVGLDIFFIGVMGMDVEGAAFATILAQAISAVLCIKKLMSVNESYRISLKELTIDPDMLRLTIKYGLPSGFQNSIIAIANVLVQTNINGFGEMAMSGCGAYSKLEGFGFMPITSFSMALSTFVGQNLGAKNYDRTKQGARFGVFSCIILAEIMGILTYIFAPMLIGAFTQESEAIAYGVERCRVICPFYFLLAASHAYSAVLRGAGKATVPMFTMFAFWCIVRVSFLLIMTPIIQSIAVVNWVYPLTWSLSAVTLLIYYLKADWIHAFEK